MAPPDSELLHRYVTARDDAAFTQIVHRHIDLVYAAARRQVGDPHHAQEIAQAVFTTLARRAPALLSHPTLVGWLHTTTRYIASEGQRAERRRQQREAELILMNETENEPTPDWAALRPVIDEALGQLKPADREVVLLRFFSSRPFAAIGAALDVPENTARMRVGRALEKLRAVLAKRGIHSSAAALGTALTTHAGIETAPALLAATTASTALAGASGSGLGAAALLMSTSKLPAAIAVAALLATGAAWVELREARAGERQLHAISAARAATEARTADLERRLRDARDANAGALARPAVPRPASASVSAPAATPGPVSLEQIRERYLQRRSVARSDPVYQQLQGRLRALETERTYGPFFAATRLSPEEVARFVAILGEEQQNVFDIQAAGEAKNVPSGDPSLEQLAAAAAERRTQQLRALLGEDRFAAFRDYEQTTPLRGNIIEPVAAELAVGAAPMSSLQAEQLLRTLARHARLGVDGNKDEGTLDWPAARAEASTFLTPPQLLVLERARQRREWSDTLATALSPLVNRAAAPRP